MILTHYAELCLASALVLSTLNTEAWVVYSTASLRRRTTAALAVASTSVPTGALSHNIVLRPSTDDESAFDSFKIGNARVHRYSRDQQPDSEDTEYVMWYHGRSVAMNSERDLPPLSTGRIGRATSNNGLVWLKDKAGSPSEDMDGVSLGLNKDSWWAFDTAHVGLGNVLLPMTTPTVLTEGGVYFMYYFGGSFDETMITDYMERDPPVAIKDSKIQGMRMKIGVAVSQDGRTWGRVEGDHPSGACLVPFDASDPNSQGNRPPDMEEELYCAWPDVVVNRPTSGLEDRFLMFYSTMTKTSKEKCIAYATSTNGFRWIKKGICLRPDVDGLDAAGCARCSVIRDAAFNSNKRQWEELDSWSMYYEGVSPTDRKHRIMKAQSQDGYNWYKAGIALDVGDDGTWDCEGVGSAHIVRMDDGNERMYYTGQGSDGCTAIGVAKLAQADQEREWLREQATLPSLPNRQA